MCLNYTSSIDNITEINSSFDTGVLRIAYHGLNRNNSFISKESFERNIKSMYNCPVVTNYDRNAVDANGDKGDFGSHDAHLEVEKDENGNIASVEIINDTYPIGVVYESAEYWWEEIEDESGMHEYLCTNVILWKRQDAYNKLKEGKVFNHSMEIEVLEGNFAEQGYYNIVDFQFTAFCILSNSVIPCFEQSNIQVFNNNNFKTQFTEMIKELKETVNFSQNQSSQKEVDNISLMRKGGNIVDEKLELLKKYNLTSDSLNFNIEEISLEELEVKIKEHFDLLASQKTEEIINALRVEKYKDRWGDEYSRYSYVDSKNDMVFAYDKQDNWNLYGFTYSMSGDKVIIDFASKARKKFDIVDFIEGESTVFGLFPQEAIDYALNDKDKEYKNNSTENVNEEFETLKVKVTEYEANINTLTEQFNSIKTENETLKQQNTTLQEFKSQIETAQREAYESQQKELKTEMIDNFSKVLTPEEVKSVTDQNLNAEEMQTKFELLFAKKELATKFTKKNKKDTKEPNTEVPLFNFSIKKKDDWTSCIKK
jgi:hypothetical protein